MSGYADPYLAAVRAVAHELRAEDHRRGQPVETARWHLWRALEEGDASQASAWLATLRTHAAVLPEEHRCRGPLQAAVDGLEPIVAELARQR